jgi:hypothetical protein
VKLPASVDLAPLAELARTADEALVDAQKDFGENNFGLAMGDVVRAQDALREVSRLRLPLAVATQHVYNAEINLRFADAPEQALAELEKARDFLAETLLEAGKEERVVLGKVLDRLVAVIDDSEVSREEKVTQLDALLLDLAGAVSGTGKSGG